MNWLEETNSNQNDATNHTIRIPNLKTERRLIVVLHCILNDVTDLTIRIFEIS